VRGFRHVSRLALEVLRRTDHTLLVGEGAVKFARALGFPEESLLTEKSRRAWLEWKANLSTKDGWLSAEELEGRAGSGFGQALWAGNTDPSRNQAIAAHQPAPGDGTTAAKVPFTYGTIHLSARTASGDLASVTSTSGLSYKIAGRVGDSPIVGAGLYTDNAVGSAGATGRGEATMQACAAYAAVVHMERGDTPEEACLRVLRSIVERTRERRLLDAHGRPAFNVTMYALRQDGLTGSASMHEGYEHVVWEGGAAQVRRCAFLFPKA
jgi:N4-(beta-N-acetylglucosaminyl)-L-asparaginase